MTVIRMKRPSDPSRPRRAPLGRTERRAKGNPRVALALGNRTTFHLPCKVELDSSGELHWTTTSLRCQSLSFLDSLSDTTLDLLEARAA